MMQMDWKVIDFKCLAIEGTPRSGKTALAYSVMENYDCDKYVFMHPKPEILPLGIKNCYGEFEIENLHDCILWIDEPSLYSTLQENHANNWLKRLMSICAQRGIKLIISTSDTRFITRGIESYIDAWAIKDIEIDLVKQGSMIKKIIRDACMITPRGFNLPVNEYVFYSRKYKEYNGRQTFEKPTYFTDELSKPYHVAKTQIESQTKTEPKIEQKTELKDEDFVEIKLRAI